MFQMGDAPALSNLLLERIFARLLGKKSSDASLRVIGRHIEKIYIYISSVFGLGSTFHRINVFSRKLVAVIIALTCAATMPSFNLLRSVWLHALRDQGWVSLRSSNLNSLS